MITKYKTRARRYVSPSGRTSSGPSVKRYAIMPERETNPIGSGKLRVIVLGGLEEVGRNMTLFEYNKEVIIIDMGLQFPEEDMPGIDYIIPDVLI